MIYFPDPESALDAIPGFVFVIVQWIRFAAESLSIIIITIGTPSPCT